jgi:hypothetical protein
MQSIVTPPSFIARAETLARFLVQGSAASAVVVGCLLTSPSVGLAVGVTFVITALLARWRCELATAVVLFLAYVNGGLMLAFAPPLTGAPLWLAAMTGLVAGGVPWRSWRAPLAWRWPLILWVLGVALSWPIIAAREMDFSLMTPREGLAAVLVGALANLSAGLLFDSMLSWNAETIERRVARPLLASALVSGCVVFYQGFVDLTWLSSDAWARLGRAPGMMGDANPMAVALGIWAPLAFAMLRTRHRVPIGGTVMVALWCAAWLTGARTFLLQFFTGIAGLLKGAMSGLEWTRVALTLLGGAIVVATILAFVPLQFFVRGPISRLINNFPARQPTEILYQALWSRDGYGIAAVEAFRENPWSGVGVGTYNYIQVDYHPYKRDIRVNPDNAQNFWRQMLAERGIFAFIAVAALTIATCRLLIRRVEAPPLLASTLKATIIGLGLALVFGVPTQNTAIAITALTLIAWLHALGSRPKTLSARYYAAALVTAWGLAVAGVTVDAWKAATDLRPATRAARGGDFYAYGFGDSQIGLDGSRGRAILRRAVAAVAATSTEYEVRFWTGATRDQRLRVWRDGTLVLDELVRPGAVTTRVLHVPPRSGGVLLEFGSDSSEVIVGGGFR